MRKIFNLLMGAALLATVATVWADDMGKKEGAVTPTANTTPVVKHKAKVSAAKLKKSKAVSKKEKQSVWYCSMGDYTGPKTADGKCPKCGMDLIEKK